MAPKTYEDGLLEGEIKLLQSMTQTHQTRLDSHTQRLSILERIVWMVSGIVVFLQSLPWVQDILLKATP